MLEYIRLVQLVVVQVIGLVEDEKCFFTLTFMKYKLRNQLIEHLEMVMNECSIKSSSPCKTSLLEQQSKLEIK
jgi:hypothetical protein